MAYTYHYGVECAKCGSFIPVNSYMTEHPGGKTDVTLDANLRCESCQHQRHYGDADIVFSKSGTVVVPLDVQQGSVSSLKARLRLADCELQAGDFGA